MSGQPNPYATPAASLKERPLATDAHLLRRVRWGIDILIGAEAATIGLRFVPLLFGRVGTALVAMGVAAIWAVGVYVATTPVGERATITNAARWFSVAAALASSALILWESQTTAAIMGGALWSNYALTSTAAIATTGTQALVLLVLRSVLALARDHQGLRATTIGVWLLGVALLARQINMWAWRLAGNEIVSTLQRYDEIGRLSWYRGLSVFVVGVLSLAGFVYYLGGLIRVRRHCSRISG